jgi:dihydropteroate synthase
MGIVNIGDDSVADSNTLDTLAKQLRFALGLLEDGAQIIDIGVQSGRTDTPQISPELELQRMLPLIGELSAAGVAVSVDTWRSGVARGAIAAGASLINDTSGLADLELARIAAECGAGLVLMHTRARPKQEHFPGYEDPMADVLEFLRERKELAVSLGVSPQQLILDPGPDFAKTPAETIAVLRRLPELGSFGLPILLAVSRKYFIGMLSGKGPEDRLAGTLAAIEFGLNSGASILRVHDVAALTEYLSVRSGLREDSPPRFKGDVEEERLKWIAPKHTSEGRRLGAREV